jgi:hypothetical protein
MEQINQVLKTKTSLKKNNVNVDNSVLNNVNVDNVGQATEIFLAAIENQEDKPRAIAEIICDKLGDSKDNLRFHLKMANKYREQPEVLIECVHIALAAQKDGIVRTTVAKYYVGVLRRKKMI